MATFKFHGGELQPSGFCDPGYPPARGPRTSTRPQRTRIVGGVRLTKTALGWTAQDVQIEHHDSTPGYWWTRIGSEQNASAARTLARLVGQLVHAGHLVKDADAGDLS